VTTVSPGAALVALAWLLTALAALAGLRVASHWRVGRAASVDWAAGFVALPKRYLVDVHHVVARKPEAARMHMLVAGGLLGGTVLLLLGALPVLRGLRPYWALVMLAFAAGLAGAFLESKRRRPRTPPHLSAGKFLWLPVFLAMFLGGGFIVSGAEATQLPGGLIGVLLAAVGGAGLLAQLLDGPMRHVLAGTVHLIAHPRPARFGGRDTALAPLDLDATTLGAATPADFAWNRLAAFDACIQCGRCEQACPAFAAGQPLNPKKLIQDLAASLHGRSDYTGSPYPGAPVTAAAYGPAQPIIGADAVIHPDTLWSCTTCRACVQECPMMIEHVDAIIDLRRHETLARGAVPEKAALPLSELRYADEPGGRSLSARTDFAAGLDLPVLEEGGETDVLLWLGEGAFDLRYGRTLRALVRLLRRAGVDFAVLGAEERDCGDLARRLGDEATFQRLARENIATLARRNFRRIVTADPHALHVLRNEYPAFGGSWTVLHHTALLDGLVRLGRLIPVSQHTELVAYHDPCYLARYNGEIEAPRRLLDAVATARVEMPRHGMRSMCCGGGGGSPVSDVPGERRIADIRMDQVREAGASVVAVACPGCTAMLEGVTGPRPEVRDVAELLLDAVENSA
jgi:Fe-S oxidoreductase